MKIIRKKFIQIIFLFITVVFTAAVCAQNPQKENPAKNLSLKLQQKVLLSDEQTERVEGILAEYINSRDVSTQKEADRKIQALLDERQKAKYEIVKNDLWAEANKAAASNR